MGEDLSALSIVLEERTPDPFHLSLVHSTLLVLVVKSCKEPSVKAHFSKDSWSGRGVAKGIDVPGDSGADLELLHQEVMALLHVIDKIIEMRASLIRHAPASVEEL